MILRVRNSAVSSFFVRRTQYYVSVNVSSNGNRTQWDMVVSIYNVVEFFGVITKHANGCSCPEPVMGFSSNGSSRNRAN